MKLEPQIYIVDKNLIYAKKTRACLEGHGYSNIKVFQQGEDCFLKNAYDADIVVLDYDLGMGCWDGIEFMEEYIRNAPHAKFIFLSSNTKIDKAVLAIKKGASDYIVKSKHGLLRVAKQIDAPEKIPVSLPKQKKVYNFAVHLTIAFCIATAALVSWFYTS